MDFGALVASAGGTLWVVVFFVIALSIIVAIHEYGHYIVARWSGIDAEVFSVGFGPILFSRVDKRGTRWQIAALPLGGYVKFLGDKNAASVGHNEDVPAARNTIHGAPLWARSATVAAGPMFNFILSIAIFMGLIFSTGVASDPLTVEDILPTPAAGVTLQAGDIMRAVDGNAVSALEEFSAATENLPHTQTISYRVERAGDVLDVVGPHPYPPIALSISPNSASLDAGLESGDVVTAVDGQPIFAFSQLQDAVRASAGAAVLLDVWRDAEMLQFTLVPRQVDVPMSEGGFETRYLIGITGGLAFEPATSAPGVWEAFNSAVQRTWFIITSSISGLWNVVTGAISSCNISGPVGIAQTSGAMAAQGTMSFISFIAVLSTAVGLLNLFPVPMLDGGHLMFHAYEAVTGRQPSNSALQWLMTLGLTMVLSLMVFALSNDLFLCP